MRRPIMIALDGSEKDGRALAVGTALARLSGGALYLVRVIADPTDRSAGLLPVQGLYDADAERAEAESQLSRLAGTLAAGDRAVATAVVPSRDVAATLVEHAAEQDALVVVLATRAPKARSRAIAGSVADHVMRECSRPVVLVPPGAAFLAGREPRIRRVLVPLDGSTLSFRSIEFIIDLPHAKDLEYVLLEIIPEERERVNADARLRTTAAWLRSRGVASVEARVVLARDAASAIVAEVREVLPEVIAMSTRGAGGLGRLMLGSVAEGVVRKSELPVLLLTPRVLSSSPHSK